MRHALAPLPKTLGESVARGIALFLPYLARRSLRRGLRGVWARGNWISLSRNSVENGVIMAANHHSWWDAYLVWLVSQKLAWPMTGMMGEAQLERFRFFRYAGVIGHSEVREAIRRLKRGHLLFVFPEGELRPTDKVGQTWPGFAFLAEKTGAPVHPLAIRVAMRGAQYPEAFLSLGPALEPNADQETTVRSFQSSINRHLAEIDNILLASDPEAPPVGFEVWMEGARSVHERTAWVAQLLRREQAQR